ncbi:MAG: Uma2 family endonuclease [Planctomycetes bacterium]|nr:Uma2 family endonuclease [Planctomycetota bacterium]
MTVQVLKRRFTVEEYYRMGEAGILRPDDRVELLEGEVVEMSPIGPEHASCVTGIDQLLQQRLGDRAVVRVQSPVRLGPRSEPQPDLALARPPAASYAKRHPAPSDLFLVIEVADTTLETDREVKLPLYARARVEEVWLVDLEGQAVEVHRRPVRGAYQDVRRVARGGRLELVSLAGGSLTVEEVLGIS